MNRTLSAVGGTLLLAFSGCNPMADLEAPPKPRAEPTEVRRPAEPAPRNVPPPPVSTASRTGPVDVTWDTPRDEVYAKFLRDHAGGMIQAARVGVDRKGVLEVKLDKSVAPDDTLELTKSLMSGVRKEFPDKPVDLKVFDPSGGAILTAHFVPGQGVKYQLAHSGASRTQAPPDRSSSTTPPPPAPASESASSESGSGVTEGDRKFARWAEEHGKTYLRYVEADLEKHGRLWFGVTREIKPADVKDLTRSLLEGAQKEFPQREIVATVFDPQGDRIGRALLGADGSIRWER